MSRYGTHREKAGPLAYFRCFAHELGRGSPEIPSAFERLDTEPCVLLYTYERRALVRQSVVHRGQFSSQNILDDLKGIIVSFSFA